MNDTSYRCSAPTAPSAQPPGRGGLAGLALGLTALVALGGCTSTTPNYDARFGEAVRQNRLAMTVNPDAGSNPNNASGLDGASAHEAMNRYQSSFKTPPPVINVINLGGSGSSNSGSGR